MLSYISTARKSPRLHRIRTNFSVSPSQRYCRLKNQFSQILLTSLSFSVQVPNETYKAAAHLVVTGRKRKYPNVSIILAHLGGSTIFLAPRAAIGASYMGCTLTPDEMLHDFKTFYYDTALAAYESNLAAAEKFVGHERVLFGSDFPGEQNLFLDTNTAHF